MIKKTRIKNASGMVKTQIRVVESYRPGPGKNAKQRTIKNFGYMEDQPDRDRFMEEVQGFNENYRKQNEPLRIEANGTAQMYGEENKKLNYGHKYLESVYDSLKIDEYIESRMKREEFRGEYSVGEIIKYLVMMRILNPESKRATYQMKESLYGREMEFTLADMYRSLDKCAEMEVGLQQHLNEVVKKSIGRDLSHAFYDVTNYYFEIDYPEGSGDIRQGGVSKEHRVDPIAAMGLFMDGNSLPVSMSIFPGNTSDSITLEPAMKEIKRAYELGRLTVVADKGLNSSKNIAELVKNGDGYVFSQILKGTKGKRYHGKLFDESGWNMNKDQSYKYKIFEEEYAGKDNDGKIVKHKRKVLLYWDRASSEMSKRKRDAKLEKASRSVRNNVYSIKKGIDEYTKENIVDKKTGELLENTVTKRSVNHEKAAEDAKFDGYWCIVTSELEYDEAKMREVYGGLWKIEQSFRILKSDLYARPVFVSKNEHIRAHFLICFVALLVVRIIQHHMVDRPLSAERIARALAAANCRVAKGGIVQLDDVGGAIAFRKRLDKHGNLVDTLTHADDDEIALDFALIQNLFGTHFSNVFLRQELFNNSLNAISL